METLLVPYVASQDDLEKEFCQLESSCLSFSLTCLNWKEEYPYLPVVNVQVGWNPSGFYLVYQVQEQQTLATNTRLRGAVHNDSCVEFFLSPDGGKSYYNFEFNPVGSIYAAYHDTITNKEESFSDTQLDRITVLTPFEKFKPLNLFNTPWRLRMHIPADLFRESSIFQAPITANFYKCGDQLEVPHFVSWSPIDLPQPNFHCPQFFGRLKLMYNASPGLPTNSTCEL